MSSVTPGSSNIPSSSAFATLYRPYIYCPPGSCRVAQKFQKFALQRIKETSCATALHCYKISQALKVGEEFPIGMYVVALSLI